MESSSFGSARITWAVQRLILVNIIIFALQLLSDPLMVWLNAKPGFYGGGLSPWLGFQQQRFLSGFVWTPITYQFMHSGLMHLFTNMVCLYDFGPDVERVLGTRSFFRFYLICGAAGVMATMLPYLLRGEVTNVVGASGAVMGVLVAFALVEPDREFFLLLFPWPINARALVMIVVVMNIISSLDGTSVSVLTHFGGMGVGFLYMKILPIFISMRRERRRKDVKSKKPPNDKVGEAVDNIFKFDDRKRR
jgi:membrane associated rhomboid family serine protease